MKKKAKLIIIHNDKLLLLNPIGKHKLTLVGGTVSKDEYTESAIIREAKEEANIKIKPREIKFFRAAYVEQDYDDLLFYCYVLNKKVENFRLNEKHKFTDLNWVSFEEALNRLKGVEQNMVELYLKLNGIYNKQEKIKNKLFLTY